LFRSVAERHDVKPAQVALAWLISRPGVTAPIASATKIEHVDGFVEAINLQLTPEDILTLDKAGA
ncbi:MAG TPA: alcohol dehydrogenase, partial [Enterobacteriaceae bacterium]|nr:alcohol dehydrogenase [Enterobacteriaceae bacterium]